MDHYEVLGLGKDATEGDMFLAYRREKSFASRTKDPNSVQRLADVEAAWQGLPAAEKRPQANDKPATVESHARDQLR